jgi:lactoylglutathione lyase
MVLLACLSGRLLGKDDRHRKGTAMRARFVHWCIHVIDKDAAIAFYEKALGFHVDREKGPADGSWSNTFMVSPESPFELELTWNRGRTEPYANGGSDTHIAFRVDDIDAAHALHKEMGCIVYENPDMGLYFIADPDGSWIEVLPEKG